MRKRNSIWIAAIAVAVTGWNGAAASPARGPCKDALTQGIPARPEGAPGGRAFADGLRGLSEDERESRIEHELLSGNIPDFLRRLVPVKFHQPGTNGQALDIVVCAAPDYLAVGSDDDFLLVPMRLGTALSTATQYGLTLPTPGIVDAIYAQATVHFVPQPLPAGDDMRSTDYFRLHNDMIGVQRSSLGASTGELSAGHKKDLVLTSRLWSHLDRVAIYGWHLTNGEPIQPLSTVHGWRYADYSHGIRLISAQAFVNGIPEPIVDVLRLPALAGALNGADVVDNLAGLIGALRARVQTAMAVLLQNRKIGI
ncbi:MAG: hypothetical protein ACHQIL_02065 [Steroidobacterales bacterium]